MTTKITTMFNLDVAILEPRGSLIGGEETDDIKSKCRDLLEQGNRKLVIDLKNVSYLNSTGIGTLVAIHAMYKNSQGGIRLCSIGESIQNVFVITKLMSVFNVDETRKAAIAAFR
jgi:anti-sigma B factor antagonist